MMGEEGRAIRSEHFVDKHFSFDGGGSSPAWPSRDADRRDDLSNPDPVTSSTWQLDSQGNRYAPANSPTGTVSPYPTSYNQSNESVAAAASYSPDGSVNSIGFGKSVNFSGSSGYYQESRRPV